MFSRTTLVHGVVDLGKTLGIAVVLWLSAQTLLGDPLFSAPAVGYVNFSARLDSRDGRWYAYLAARNLTDKRWIEGVSATPGGAGLLYWTVVNQARSFHVGAGTRF